MLRDRVAFVLIERGGRQVGSNLLLREDDPSDDPAVDFLPPPAADANAADVPPAAGDADMVDDANEILDPDEALL